jgi:hypothetical protein
MAVYFLQPPAGGPIKIGYTINLRMRLESLSAGQVDGLVVLATIPGNRLAEKEIHNRFAASRKYGARGVTVGEWFEPTQDLVDYIRSIGGDPRGPVVEYRGPMQPKDFKSDGQRLLLHYLRDNDIHASAISEALDCHSVTVPRWLNGVVFPDRYSAEIVKILTRGSVPAESWTRLNGEKFRDLTSPRGAFRSIPTRKRILAALRSGELQVDLVSEAR